MALRTVAGSIVRFSVFELDLRSGELRKSGARVPLPGQPLEILKALLERPGDLITRDELRLFVDFEDGTCLWRASSLGCWWKVVRQPGICGRVT